MKIVSSILSSLLKVLKQPVIFTVLLVLLAGSSVYLFARYQKAQTELTKIKENPQVTADVQSKELVAKVGQLIALPDKETPTVATVTDVTKLKSQSFFAKAKNGDKVLIYTQAKKAILYRESINKVIDVAPINIGQSQNLKVALYNGTATTGATNTLEKRIQDKKINIDVVLKEDASAKDYEKTLVIDLSGNQSATADQLAKLFNGQVVSLPKAETKPNADILIIIGKNFSQ